MAFDKYVHKPNENKSIGILLWREISWPDVELTVQDYDKPKCLPICRLDTDIPEPYNALTPLIDGVQQIVAENAEPPAQ